MKNELVVGFSCCMIGTYNFWSFYQQNKLYLFNFSFYFTILIIGLIFLYKAQAKVLQNKQDATLKGQNNNPIAFSQKQNRESLISDIDIIQELSPDSQKYLKVSKHVNKLIDEQKKLHQKKLSLSKIFGIKNDEIKKKFKNHQLNISNICKCEGLEGPANTNYVFHGTKKICSQPICKGNNSFSCPLCGIIKNGFQTKFAGKGASTNLRFGNGIYFSPDLKKAIDYTDGDNKILILMTKVVLGRVYFAKDSDSFLDEFNENKFHSIYADPRVTHDLKQSEICVFKDESCWPKYLLEFNSI